MSGLRQVVAKKDTPPQEDIEAPKDKGKASNAFAVASASNSGGGHNPVFLAKVIFRKVFNLLVTSDEEDITQPGGIITLFKDIIVGIILGVLTISTLIFLDHRDVVHFQSAHNFRNAAFQLLNDPETISNIEESSDLKFMTLTDYEYKRKEIDSVTDKIASKEEALEKRTNEAEERKKEVASIKEEYESLMTNPILGLDKFCGGCAWNGKVTCEGRVQFLQATYNTRPIAAKINSMIHTSCIKK
mmetsp:Transcript_31438/g.58111  ORF Transcript_31438/g.58111 Transcript_31438/m.58111 type:complete len:244 (-) Transcript_31438:615-1346(-)